MPSPIALFVYNRPLHTQRTVEALRANQLAGLSNLIIFSDGPKTKGDELSVSAVRTYLKGITGFNSIEIIESQVNKGLALSIIDGVTQVLNDHATIIVVEDDLVTSPYFLDYLNQGLNLYLDESEVISIHGYVLPAKTQLPETFFLRGADCWGWATWRRGWAVFEKDGSKLLRELRSRNLVRDFDFDNSYSYTKMLSDQINGLNNSWAVRWYASAFLANKFTLYPGVSFVANIGLDNTGTNSGLTKGYDVIVGAEKIVLKKVPIVEDTSARKAISDYMRKVNNSRLSRIKNAILQIFGK